MGNPNALRGQLFVGKVYLGFKTVKLWGRRQDLQQVVPHVQASVDKGGERAPQVCGWVKKVVNDGVGGGGRGVGEGPVEQEIGKLR